MSEEKVMKDAAVEADFPLASSSIKFPRETLPAILFDGSFTRAGGDALKFYRHLEGDIQSKESVGIQLTDAQKIMQFRSRLRGDAVNWYHALGNTSGWTYNHLIEKFHLVSEFGRVRPESWVKNLHSTISRYIVENNNFRNN